MKITAAVMNAHILWTFDAGLVVVFMVVGAVVVMVVVIIVVAGHSDATPIWQSDDPPHGQPETPQKQ